MARAAVTARRPSAAAGNPCAQSHPGRTAVGDVAGNVSMFFFLRCAIVQGSRQAASFGELHGDEAGDARFAHGDADEVVAGLHGAFAVGDDDELGLCRHVAQEVAEAANVRIIERRVHFVQQAEGRGVQAEEGEDEGEGGEGFFAAGEDAQVFDFFAGRAHSNGDAGIQYVAFRPGEFGFAAAKEDGEEVGEMAVDDVQGFLQAAAGFVVEFVDGFFEQRQGVAQVAALGFQRAVFVFGAVVVGDGGEVDGAECFFLLFEGADVGVERGFVFGGFRQGFVVVAEEFGDDALLLLVQLFDLLLVVLQAFFGELAAVVAFAPGFLFVVQFVGGFFEGLCGFGALLFVCGVGLFVGFEAEVVLFEGEGEGFELFV